MVVFVSRLIKALQLLVSYPDPNVRNDDHMTHVRGSGNRMCEIMNNQCVMHVVTIPLRQHDYSLSHELWSCRLHLVQVKMRSNVFAVR